MSALDEDEWSVTPWYPLNNKCGAGLDGSSKRKICCSDRRSNYYSLCVMAAWHFRAAERQSCVSGTG